LRSACDTIVRYRPLKSVTTTTGHAPGSGPSWIA
jgi:hypothetical protein